jgi:hypothetical protein
MNSQNIRKMGRNCTRQTRPTAAFLRITAVGREERFILVEYRTIYAHRHAAAINAATRGAPIAAA